MTINDFYKSLGLRVEPFATEWQGQNDHVIVLKLWDKNKDWLNGRILCQTPPDQRPVGNRGGKWDRRQEAIEEIRAGRKLGFFTIGYEGGGETKNI